MEDLDTNMALEVVQGYASALNLLDDYDHQCIVKPAGSESVYVLNYEECRELISTLRFGNESDLFGVEKDDSFLSSIAAVYQSFAGQDLYPSTQEKAANLLYFIVKNHSFHDGNKRIAAVVFLYFLARNGLLYRGGRKRVSDSALVATTIMIAESKPEEKEIMVSLVMNFLA
ncbi:type II toxin-antitoxin system death-on-curing family toxin [Anaerotardibacter muris]|uniref:type II toxin-antitoxin system death-on-curing family toxin n=1 Tax=Anaerotardibacter muris TaxID=2941505 RepID=UPI0020420F00|nr:Fic family protein [Anaerotardibacter muris]